MSSSQSNSSGTFVKPSRLSKGDTVAVLSPSWGGPNSFPHVYELGVKMLETAFGLKVTEYPTTSADADFLYANPKLRAEDVNRAFSDHDVKAIFSSIGGEDSIRILPFLDPEIIKSNPKILMGYSDTTTLLNYVNQLGLVTFHGPSVMAGFSQLQNLPLSFANHVRQMLFQPAPTFEYGPYESWSEGYPDWGQKENLGKLNASHATTGWSWVRGKSIARGELFGGNIEVLEWLRGTPYWPDPGFWQGKILFLETSEEKPHRAYVRRWLRSFGILGGLEKITGLLFGRARDYSDEEKKALERNIVSVVAEEFKRPDLPIVANMDFGHTDPQFIVPLGVRAEIDCETKRFRLVESAIQ